MDFSWTDRFRATIGSCVPCLVTPADGDSDDERQSFHHNTLYRDELEGLLIDSQTDNEADAMSLHSNPGAIPMRGGGKKKGKGWRKKRKNAAARKGVKLFGYDLFGRPMPDPEYDSSDDGDETEPTRPPRRSHFGMYSSSTLDSDAAPLSDSAIADLSKWEPPLTDADLAREEEEQRLLEEKVLRKERRKERKELKRVAAAMAAGIIRDEDEFEGFQGSGAQLPTNVPPFGRPRRATIDDEEFGPFAGANGGAQQSPSKAQSSKATTSFAADAAADAFEEEEEGDFGGEYNRKSKSGNMSGSGSGSRSHSRSRSGTSGGQGGQVATYRLQGSNPYNVPLPSSASGSTPRRADFLESPTPKRSKKSSSSKTKQKDASKSDTSNRSRSSANSSSSIRSPPPQQSSNDLGVRVVMEQEFEGFPGGGLDAADVAAAANAAAAAASSQEDGNGLLSPVDGTANGFRFPAPSSHSGVHDDHDGTAGGFQFPTPNSGFPSTGFSSSGFPSTGFGRKTAGGGAAGVALARRGDE